MIDVDQTIENFAKITGISEDYVKLLGLCVVSAGIAHSDVSKFLVDNSLDKIGYANEAMRLMKMNDGNTEFVKLVEKRFGKKFTHNYKVLIEKRNSIIHSFTAWSADNVNPDGFEYAAKDNSSDLNARNNLVIINREFIENYLKENKDMLDFLMNEREKEELNDGHR